MKDILVIGESCRDVFMYCDTIRLAPDYPVPVLNITNQIENGGMAKNVHRNIDTKVPCDIHTNDNWQSITKTRYVHDKTNHMFFRVDNTIHPGRINLADLDLDYRIVVISDYNKGFLKPEDIAAICDKHSCVFLDTKKVLCGDWAKNAKYIKINDFEYQCSKDVMDPEIEKKIIHTMGGEGCEYAGTRFPVKKVDVKDTSGAGDSFMAALVIKYLQTNDILRAIRYANECASEVVKYRGVVVI